MAQARLNAFEAGGLVFDSCFDSGNAARVEQLDEHEFALWTAGDCAGTPHAKEYRTWFCFSVRGVARGRILNFRIYNMNCQGKLFRNDMRPVYRQLPSKPGWARLPLAASHTGTKEEDNFVLKFRHKCDCEITDTIYFAFCFPHTYADSMARLAHLDELFGLPPAHVAPPGAPPPLRAAPPAGGDLQPALASLLTLSLGEEAGAAAAKAGVLPAPAAAERATERAERAAGASAAAAASSASSSSSSTPLSRAVHLAALTGAASAADAACCPAAAEIGAAAVQYAASAGPPRKPGNVYYHRELLTRSLDGRRVDLLTISGTNGMLPGREEPVAVNDPLLMPEGGERPRAFANKRVFFLSARVHPGEVPASHVLDGFLSFILREDDPRAMALRERFVFKLVPIINPDGVYRGHYRADTLGQNLNRCYSGYEPSTIPSVHAIFQVISQLHARKELMFYVDTHGHATKRGCFLFGNAIPEQEKMVDNVLYAKLVAANCRWFDFGGCVFSEKNMYRKDLRDGLSKAGSGRVATYKATDLTYIYTLECNYNVGRLVNRVQQPDIPKGLNRGCMSPPPPPLRTVNPKYTPEVWRDVGKALAIAALDIIQANPCSRMGAPSAGGLARLRSTVAAWVRTQAKKKEAKAPRTADADDSDDDGEDDGEAEGEENGGSGSGSGAGSGEEGAPASAAEAASSASATAAAAGANENAAPAPSLAERYHTRIDERMGALAIGEHAAGRGGASAPADGVTPTGDGVGAPFSGRGREPPSDASGSSTPIGAPAAGVLRPRAQVPTGGTNSRSNSRRPSAGPALTPSPRAQRTALPLGKVGVGTDAQLSALRLATRDLLPSALAHKTAGAQSAKTVGAKGLTAGVAPSRIPRASPAGAARRGSM